MMTTEELIKQFGYTLESYVYAKTRGYYRDVLNDSQVRRDTQRAAVSAAVDILDAINGDINREEILKTTVQDDRDYKWLKEVFMVYQKRTYNKRGLRRTRQRPMTDAETRQMEYPFGGKRSFEIINPDFRVEHRDLDPRAVNRSAWTAAWRSLEAKRPKIRKRQPPTGEIDIPLEVWIDKAPITTFKSSARVERESQTKMVTLKKEEQSWADMVDEECPRRYYKTHKHVRPPNARRSALKQQRIHQFLRSKDPNVKIHREGIITELKGTWPHHKETIPGNKPKKDVRQMFKPQEQEEPLLETRGSMYGTVTKLADRISNIWNQVKSLMQVANRSHQDLIVVTQRRRTVEVIYRGEVFFFQSLQCSNLEIDLLNRILNGEVVSEIDVPVGIGPVEWVESVHHTYVTGQVILSHIMTHRIPEVRGVKKQPTKYKALKDSQADMVAKNQAIRDVKRLKRELESNKKKADPWYCKKCEYVNFPNRLTCNSCHALKAEVEGPMPTPEDLQAMEDQLLQDAIETARVADVAINKEKQRAESGPDKPPAPGYQSAAVPEILVDLTTVDVAEQLGIEKAFGYRGNDADLASSSTLFSNVQPPAINNPIPMAPPPISGIGPNGYPAGPWPVQWVPPVYAKMRPGLARAVHGDIGFAPQEGLARSKFPAFRNAASDYACQIFITAGSVTHQVVMLDAIKSGSGDADQYLLERTGPSIVASPHASPELLRLIVLNGDNLITIRCIDSMVEWPSERGTGYAGGLNKRENRSIKEMVIIQEPQWRKSDNGHYATRRTVYQHSAGGEKGQVIYSYVAGHAYMREFDLMLSDGSLIYVEPRRQHIRMGYPRSYFGDGREITSEAFGLDYNNRIMMKRVDKIGLMAPIRGSEWWSFGKLDEIMVVIPSVVAEIPLVPTDLHNVRDFERVVGSLIRAKLLESRIPKTLLRSAYKGCLMAASYQYKMDVEFYSQLYMALRGAPVELNAVVSQPFQKRWWFDFKWKARRLRIDHMQPVAGILALAYLSSRVRDRFILVAVALLWGYYIYSREEENETTIVHEETLTATHPLIATMLRSFRVFLKNVSLYKGDVIPLILRFAKVIAYAMGNPVKNLLIFGKKVAYVAAMATLFTVISSSVPTEVRRGASVLTELTGRIRAIEILRSVRRKVFTGKTPTPFQAEGAVVRLEPDVVNGRPCHIPREVFQGGPGIQYIPPDSLYEAAETIRPVRISDQLDCDVESPEGAYSIKAVGAAIGKLSIRIRSSMRKVSPFGCSITGFLFTNAFPLVVAKTAVNTLVAINDRHYVGPNPVSSEVMEEVCRIIEDEFSAQPDPDDLFDTPVRVIEQSSKKAKMHEAYTVFLTWFKDSHLKAFSNYVAETPIMKALFSAAIKVFKDLYKALGFLKKESRACAKMLAPHLVNCDFVGRLIQFFNPQHIAIELSITRPAMRQVKKAVKRLARPLGVELMIAAGSNSYEVGSFVVRKDTLATTWAVASDLSRFDSRVSNRLIEAVIKMMVNMGIDREVVEIYFQDLKQRSVSMSLDSVSIRITQILATVFSGWGMTSLLSNCIVMACIILSVRKAQSEGLMLDGFRATCMGDDDIMIANWTREAAIAYSKILDTVFAGVGLLPETNVDYVSKLDFCSSVFYPVEDITYTGLTSPKPGTVLSKLGTSLEHITTRRVGYALMSETAASLEGNTSVCPILSPLVRQILKITGRSELSPVEEWQLRSDRIFKPRCDQLDWVFNRYGWGLEEIEEMQRFHEQIIAFPVAVRHPLYTDLVAVDVGIDRQYLTVGGKIPKYTWRPIPMKLDKNTRILGSVISTTDDFVINCVVQPVIEEVLKTAVVTHSRIARTYISGLFGLWELYSKCADSEQPMKQMKYGLAALIMHVFVGQFDTVLASYFHIVFNSWMTALYIDRRLGTDQVTASIQMSPFRRYFEPVLIEPCFDVAAPFVAASFCSVAIRLGTPAAILPHLIYWLVAARLTKSWRSDPNHQVATVDQQIKGKPRWVKLIILWALYVSTRFVDFSLNLALIPILLWLSRPSYWYKRVVRVSAADFLRSFCVSLRCFTAFESLLDPYAARRLKDWLNQSRIELMKWTSMKRAYNEGSDFTRGSIIDSGMCKSGEITQSYKMSANARTVSVKTTVAGGQQQRSRSAGRGAGERRFGDNKLDILPRRSTSAKPHGGGGKTKQGGKHAKPKGKKSHKGKAPVMRPMSMPCCGPYDRFIAALFDPSQAARGPSHSGGRCYPTFTGTFNGVASFATGGSSATYVVASLFNDADITNASRAAPTNQWGLGIATANIDCTSSATNTAWSTGTASGTLANGGLVWDSNPYALLTSSNNYIMPHRIVGLKMTIENTTDVLYIGGTVRAGDFGDIFPDSSDINLSATTAAGSYESLALNTSLNPYIGNTACTFGQHERMTNVGRFDANNTTAEAVWVPICEQQLSWRAQAAWDFSCVDSGNSVAGTKRSCLGLQLARNPCVMMALENVSGTAYQQYQVRVTMAVEYQVNPQGVGWLLRLCKYAPSGNLPYDKLSRFEIAGWEHKLIKGAMRDVSLGPTVARGVLGNLGKMIEIPSVPPKANVAGPSPSTSAPGVAKTAEEVAGVTAVGGGGGGLIYKYGGRAFQYGKNLAGEAMNYGKEAIYKGAREAIGYAEENAPRLLLEGAEAAL